MNKIYTEDIDIDQRLIGRRLFDQSRIIFPLLYQLLEKVFTQQTKSAYLNHGNNRREAGMVPNYN